MPSHGQCAVHPHVCGEYDILTPEFKELNRFIPTCVGNTRGCQALNSDAPGSSPRVWGIRVVVGGDEIDRRFIPTCVGNTIRRTQKRRGFSVHPHVCGEYCLLMTAVLSRVRFIPTCVGNTRAAVVELPGEDGSSPRVWGIRWVTRWTRWRRSVHPHVCGEYVVLMPRALRLGGSSPRVWGIRVCRSA